MYVKNEKLTDCALFANRLNALSWSNDRPGKQCARRVEYLESLEVFLVFVGLPL